MYQLFIYFLSKLKLIYSYTDVIGGLVTLSTSQQGILTNKFMCMHVYKSLLTLTHMNSYFELLQ